ncbi:hypothetical protein ACJJTC_005432 [Scirpophaga incertulas]
MPKHKRNADKKIRKYKNKIRRLQLRRSSSSSTDSEGLRLQKHTESDCTQRWDEQEHTSGGYSQPMSPLTNIINLPAEVSDKNSIIPEPTEPEEPALDSETLQALGDPIVEKKTYGPPINSDLASRCITILKSGLDKENREHLINNYLTPKNCQILQAPKLNPEIIATISDNINNRDRKIEAEQQQLGQGITALNQALSLLVTNTSDRLTIIKTLSDASKILADLHYRKTMSRKKLITPVLDKKFLEIIKDVERDEFLYGGNLSDKIKAMKNAQKSGQTIKKVDHLKTINVRRPGNYSTPSSSSSGNFRGPPRYQSSKTYSRSGQKRPVLERFPYKQFQHPVRKTKAETKPAPK